MKRQQPTPPTVGDNSPLAATANRQQGEAFVSTIATPGGRLTEEQSWIGDKIAYMGGAEVVAPIEDFSLLYKIYRLSPYQESVVDTFLANVYASGFKFQPVTDTKKGDARDLIKSYIMYYLSYLGQMGGAVSDGEVDQTIELLEQKMREEKIRLQAFFRNACPGSSYLDLCYLSGQDLEIAGCAYWEVIRDANGVPARLQWVPAWSVRPTPIQSYFVGVYEAQMVTPLHWENRLVPRRFRQWLQFDVNTNIVARFKDYGDPRVMSRKTGKYYNSYDEMLQNADEWYPSGERGGSPIPAVPATEILNFNLPCSASYTYGKPKSTGTVPGLEGARDLEEYNKGLVVDQKIPNMILLMSGASILDQADVDRVIQKFSEDNGQGHRGIAVLHAKPVPNITNTKSETPEITVIKTKSEQNNDALGLQYLERVYENTRRAYRVSRISLGDDKDLQRDIAMMARRITEDETYDPRRTLFATRINSTLLPDLGVYTLQYACNSRTPKDPVELSGILGELTEHNILAPDEARQHASAILSTELPALEGAWAKLPSGLLTALLQTKNQLTAAAIMGNYDELFSKIQEAYQYLENGTNGQQSEQQSGSKGADPSQGSSTR